MATRNELQQIAETRFKEAKFLYKKGFYDGAVYLCGYVTEISLKARICKHLCMKEYKETGNNKQIFYSHDFTRLLLLSGLSKTIKLSRNLSLFNNWSILTAWHPDSRYEPIGTYSKTDAKSRIDALGRGDDGFLNWIKKKW